MDLITEGKTKKIYQGLQKGTVVFENKDQLTAHDALKIDYISDIGHLKAEQTTLIMNFLNHNHLPTAFIEPVSAHRFLCWECEMLPIEWVTRRYAWGSYLKRHPECIHTPPIRFDDIQVELFHKHAVVLPPLTEETVLIPETEARHTYAKHPLYLEYVFTDPLIERTRTWDLYPAKYTHPTECLLSIPPLLEAELCQHLIETLVKPCFLILEKAWSHIKNHPPIHLVDLKVELGQRKTDGQWLIADVIDNDSWRLWPEGNPKLQIDKQAYRDGQSLERVKQHYQTVTQLLKEVLSSSH